jgi:hypothetical protein
VKYKEHIIYIMMYIIIYEYKKELL